MAVERPYEAQNWATGDVITKNKIQHIEDGIAAIDAELVGARREGGSTTGTLGERLNDMIIVSETQPISDNNELWIKSTTTEVQVPTYEDMEDIIKVQNTQPIEEANKVWIDPSTETEISIPEYDEFEEVVEDVADLKNATDAIEAATVVYTEPTNLLHGTITNGYIINADGSIATRSEYSYSDYIEIESSKGYIAFTRQATATTRMMDGMTVAFYDSNKSFISRIGGNVKMIPGNAAYIRQNIVTTYLSNVYKPMVEYVNSTGSNVASVYSDWFEPYCALLANYGANFKNKKICVYGDSLAANGNGGDNAWINILASILQFKEAYNRGIGGSRVTNTETRYAYIDANGDAYNRSSYASQQTVPTGYTEINPCMSLSERINTIPTDTDILIVLAGANDASGVTLDAIKTAYATMLDGIYARVPDARVLLGTLLYNHNWDGSESEQIVEKYNGIRSIIKDMGALYGYPIIDFKSTMGVNNLNYAEYMDSDGVHYTTKNKGKNRIAEVAIPRVFDIKYIN